MSRNVNVPDNAVVVVLTPKQGEKLLNVLIYIQHQQGLDPTIIAKVRAQVEASR